MEAVKHISPRAEQLLSEYGLGNVKAEYKGNLLKNGLLLMFFLPVGLLMLAFFIPLLSPPSFTTNGNWLDWFDRLGNVFPALLYGGCFLFIGFLGMIMFIVMLWKGEQRVYLGEKGFIAAHRQLDTITRWEAVREVRRHIMLTKSKVNNVRDVTMMSSYVIVPAEGKKSSILADPGPAIEQAVTANHFPRTLADYTAGKKLSFGWLALDSKGLHLTPDVAVENNPTALTKVPGIARTSQKLLGTCVESGERFLGWDDVSCYWLDESRSTLVLSKWGARQHWAIVPLYQVYNSALCLALIEHVLYGSPREIA